MACRFVGFVWTSLFFIMDPPPVGQVHERSGSAQSQANFDASNPKSGRRKRDIFAAGYLDPSRTGNCEFSGEWPGKISVCEKRESKPEISGKYADLRRTRLLIVRFLFGPPIHSII
jgi:hypothetical protein